MSLTRLLGDLAYIQQLSDLPNSNENEGLTAAQLKLEFDQAVLDIQDYLNDTLIAELESTVAGQGASNIGIEAILGVTGAEVQTALESLKQLLDDVVLGQIPDGSLTYAKDDVAMKSSNSVIHFAVFLSREQQRFWGR